MSITIVKHFVPVYTGSFKVAMKRDDIIHYISSAENGCYVYIERKTNDDVDVQRTFVFVKEHETFIKMAGEDMIFLGVTEYNSQCYLLFEITNPVS